ncbi:MAG: hypothetical protein K8R99_15520 [Actinomycetia bacterium]|nr:hypothetical protein [Actinomycetes bacterium]
MDDVELPHCFIFLNQGNWVTANNLRVGGGRLCSASCGLFDSRLEELISGTIHWRIDQQPDASHGGFLSPFAGQRLGIGWQAQLEADAELVRAEKFPHCPSRLAALFVFPDFETCQLVNQLHQWDLQQVAEMEYLAVRTSICDMEIASIANGMYQAGSVTREFAQKLWKTYWSGGGINDLGVVPERPSIPEMLIDGWVRPTTKVV